MADQDLSLPVRTQTAGDVAVKVVDGTVNTQALAVDSTGRVTVKLDDGAGNAVTSQINGAQQALDVGINVAGVQVDPRAVRALTSADVVTANQGAPNTAANKWPVSLTDGTNTVGVLATGEAKVSVTQPLPTGTNTIGKVDQGTSPWVVTANNLPTTVDTNYGTVGSSTLRTAAEIGNATGAANYGNGATGAQTLRVAANLAVAGSDVSPTNPIPVTISVDNTGAEIDAYNTVSALAVAGTSNHDYTVSAGKTLLLTQIEATGSGKMKIEVQVETAAASGIFNTRFVQFNSTSSPNMSIHLVDPVSVVTGARVRVIRTNRDLLAQDVYSTICGQEV